MSWGFGSTTPATAKFERDAERGILDCGDFAIIGCIGSGGEGCVYHAWHMESGVHVALKRIPGNRGWHEFSIHRQLNNHPNILRLYGIFFEGGEDEEGIQAVWIISEYCHQGTIMDKLLNTEFVDTNAKESFLAKTVSGVLLSLKHMQQQQILHTDIKPSNILWAPDGAPKLADFGMSTELESSGGRAFIPTGTVPFMAPEALALDRKMRLRETNAFYEAFGYSYKADSWSLGVTVYELLTGGSLPFRYQSRPDLTGDIRGYLAVNTFTHRSICFPLDTSDDLKHFILSLLQVKPEKRLSVDQALKHAWILRHEQYYHYHPRVSPTNQLLAADKENNPVGRGATKENEGRADERNGGPVPSKMALRQLDVNMVPV